MSSLIDCQQPFGNGHLFPRGTLREPPEHLARAEVIFITKSDGRTEELRERISKYNPEAGIIECVHDPLYFEDVFTGERHELSAVKSKKIASLSAIAQPESFEQSLTKLCGELVYSKRFADHHRYSQQEVHNAINRGKKRQAEIIVTTQKDAVRFPKLDRRDLPIYFMRVEIKILKGAEDFDDCVRKISPCVKNHGRRENLDSRRQLAWATRSHVRLPALHRLREAKPKAHIVLLTPEKLATLWTGQTIVDNVIAFAPSSSVAETGMKLRAERFDVAIAFPNSMRSALELWLARIPRRIGLARRGRGLFLTDALPPRTDAVPMHKKSDAEVREAIASGKGRHGIPTTAHHVHDYLYLTAQLGASREPMPPSLKVSKARVAETSAKFGINDGLWLGLNPGAEYGPEKRWPVQRFIESAKIFLERNCRAAG